MKKIILFCIFNLSSVFLFGQSTDEIYSKQLLEENKYTEAITYLKKKLQQNQTLSAEEYNLLGCATIYQSSINDEKNNKEAVVYFTKAIVIDSNCINCYVNRGWAFQSINQYTKSYFDYKKAYELDTSKVDLMGNVLRNLWIRNKFKDALAMSNIIIQKFPLNGYAYHVRGNLKRDYLHLYKEGNVDIKKSEELSWRQGFYLMY